MERRGTNREKSLYIEIINIQGYTLASHSDNDFCAKYVYIF